MSATQQSSRAVVLVKALPQPSKTYGETVCCAGVTADGDWKRLFPVRFRHLGGDSSFSRWDWVRFTFRTPTRDKRVESCHVYEDSIVVEHKLALDERSRLLTPLITGSAIEAMELGRSLTLVRPRNTRFNARMTPMRAIMVGPLSSTTRSRASTAACHSSSCCSAFGSLVM
jgi:hypothetical protein